MDLLNKISEFCDTHIRIVNNLGYVVAGIGVLVIARKYRLFTQFQSVSDIPEHFVHKKLKLRAVVKNVTSDNVVNVEHVPTLSYPGAIFVRRIMQSRPEGEKFISLKLAGVSMDEAGRTSLSSELQGRRVKFKLLNTVCEEKPDVPVILYMRKNLILRNMNVHAVKMGYAVVDHIPPCYHEKTHNSLQKSIMKAQKYAAKKGKGVWKE